MEDKWRVTTAPQADTPSQKIEDPSSMSVCKLFRDVWGENMGNSQDTTCYQYNKGQVRFVARCPPACTNNQVHNAFQSGAPGPRAGRNVALDQLSLTIMEDIVADV